MAGPTLFCTLADVLALVSMDAQARLATDPDTFVAVGAGDGIKTTFDTPFLNASALSATVNGVAAATTTSVGTGPDGTDRIVFGTAPTTGLVVKVKADNRAINTDVVKLCIVLATNKIKGHLARYVSENPSAAVLAVLQPKAVFFTRWYLRMRRSMEEWDPIREEYRAENAWLVAVAKGQIALPADALIATAAPPKPAPTVDMPDAFGPPYTNVNGGLYPW